MDIDNRVIVEIPKRRLDRRRFLPLQRLYPGLLIRWVELVSEDDALEMEMRSGVYVEPGTRVLLEGPSLPHSFGAIPRFRLELH